MIIKSLGYTPSGLGRLRLASAFGLNDWFGSDEPSLSAVAVTATHLRRIPER